MISTILVFNTNGLIDRNSLDCFQRIIKVAQLYNLNQYATIDLHWVLRDVDPTADHDFL